LEYAFLQNWSAKLEYIYIATRSDNFTVGAVTFNDRVRENVVRVGVNYHF
jgi:outer membrane immunogenic protein